MFGLFHFRTMLILLIIIDRVFFKLIKFIIFQKVSFLIENINLKTILSPTISFNKFKCLSSAFFSLSSRDPNGAIPNSPHSETKNFSEKDGTETAQPPFWDTYDTINQLYLELGNSKLCPGVCCVKARKTKIPITR